MAISSALLISALLVSSKINTVENNMAETNFLKGGQETWRGQNLWWVKFQRKSKFQKVKCLGVKMFGIINIFGGLKLFKGLKCLGVAINGGYNILEGKNFWREKFVWGYNFLKVNIF